MTRARWTIGFLVAFAAFGPTRAHGAETSAVVAQGIRLFDQGKMDEALSTLMPAASAKPPDAAAAFYVGRVYMERDDYDKAGDWFEKAVKQDDKNSVYHDWWGRALGTQAQHASVIKQPFIARKVKAEFDRAVELDTDNLDARDDLISFYTQAPGVMGGSKDKAHEQAEEIARRNPYRGALARIDVAQAMKDTAAVEKGYREAIAAFPDSTGPQLGLGIWYTRGERYDQAFATFDDVLARKPGDRNALYQIGRTGALSGQQLDRAEKSMKDFLEASPNDRPTRLSSAHWRLGMIYEKQGHKDVAKQEYLAALALDPHNDNAKKALGKLK